MGTGFAKKKKAMKQAQAQFAKMQEEMAATVVEGKSPGDLVTVKMNGEQELIELKIKPECVDPDDVEGLEDLIKAAVQDANKKVKEASPMSDMPGLGGFGF